MASTYEKLIFQITGQSLDAENAANRVADAFIKAGIAISKVASDLQADSLSMSNSFGQAVGEIYDDLAKLRAGLKSALEGGNLTGNQRSQLTNMFKEVDRVLRQLQAGSITTAQAANRASTAIRNISDSVVTSGRALGASLNPELERLQGNLNVVSHRLMQTGETYNTVTQQQRAYTMQVQATNKQMNILGTKVSPAVTSAFNNIGSGAHGAMMGMNLLQGNMTGLAFSLIFMRFSMLHMTLAMAAFTLVVGKLWTEFRRVQQIQRDLNAFRVGLTNVGESAAITAASFVQAEIAIKRGWKNEDAVNSIGKLNSAGLHTIQILTLIMGLATNTGRTLEEVTDAFLNIIRPDKYTAEPDFTAFGDALFDLVPRDVLRNSGARSGEDLLTTQIDYYQKLVGDLSVTERGKKLLNMIKDDWEVIGKVQHRLMDDEGKFTPWGRQYKHKLYENEGLMFGIVKNLQQFGSYFEDVASQKEFIKGFMDSGLDEAMAHSMREMDERMG